MFTVYHSNNLEILKTLACWHMKNQPLLNPLNSEIVLVQSQGMAQWLQISLAIELGIAANIDFLLPASFIWDMFMRVLPDIPKESAFSKFSMQWKLMVILPTMLKNNSFTILRQYLSNDDSMRKLFQLSSRIADIFDQYLVYRPDWLNNWQYGKHIKGLGAAQKWQAPLWEALIKYNNVLGHPEWNRANLYQRFILTLKSSTKRFSNLPKRVFIFGISVLPPIYLQALQALSKHIDIHLLFTNPCRHYWGDIQDDEFLRKFTGHYEYDYTNTKKVKKDFKSSIVFKDDQEKKFSNPLIASWGKLGRDNLSLLTQMETNDILAFVDIKPNNLLNMLKHDLLELEDHSEIGIKRQNWNNSRAKRVIASDDRSISIHICHSPQREVEILKDCLLAIMDADKCLTPRDIIVMVADIDSYTPFIQSVFGNVTDEFKLPFAISDRHATQAHPVLQAFILILKLAESRFTMEEVLTLLEFPSIATHFKINEEGLILLRKWIVESGIRWGLDDDNVRDLGLPITGRHTWHFGLTRMMLGYAMYSDSGDWKGILPYDESNGLIAELVGNLAEFLDQLDHWRRCFLSKRLLKDWLPLCKYLLNDFFDRDIETEKALFLIEEQWQKTIIYGIQAGYNNVEISIALLRDDIIRHLEKKRISQRFLAGSVNFCTLMPMRSIPFKIVCLLGMNDGVYPRILPPISFDLMTQQRQKGDRNRRDDDRYLFLEALSSAEEKLHISYVGRSIQDNSERCPSILVTELVQYISHSCCLAEDIDKDIDSSASSLIKYLHHIHSRMPFDIDNFTTHNYYQSYAKEWLPAAAGYGVAHPPFIKKLPVQKKSELNFKDLVYFWNHPVRSFFKVRLGVKFKPKEINIPDSEPFALDNVSRYKINNQLLNCLINGHKKNYEDIYKRQRAAGILPYGTFGELFWNNQKEEMFELAQRIKAQQQQIKNSAKIWEIFLNISQITLVGWLSHVQNNGLLRWRPSVLNFNDGLTLWLEHLAYCTMGGKKSSIMLGRQGSYWHFRAIPSDEARKKLEYYIEGYKQGMCDPLLLTSSGAAWLKESFDVCRNELRNDNNTQQKAETKLLQNWYGNFLLAGECHNPYLQRIINTLNDNHIRSMTTQALRWLLPLLENQQIT